MHGGQELATEQGMEDPAVQAQNDYAAMNGAVKP
jgi:hypothetical protein